MAMAVVVPNWLSQSKLFQEAEGKLDSPDPARMRENSDISNFEDFEHVMQCMDHWGVYTWPASVFSFIAGNIDQVKRWKQSNGNGTIGGHSDLSDAIVDSLGKSDFMVKMCEMGSIGWLAYGHSQDCEWGDSCSMAAKEGHILCLQYAHMNGCSWNALTCSAAAKAGHLDCLIYARSNGCPWNGTTSSASALGGHLDCLTYAHVNGCAWNVTTCFNAARGGHLNCLRYAHENGCPWDGTICLSAGKGGHLACLEYAYHNGCPFDPTLYETYHANLTNGIIPSPSPSPYANSSTASASKPSHPPTPKFMTPEDSNIYCLPTNTVLTKKKKIGSGPRSDEDIFSRPNKHVWFGKCPCCE